jgi:hypothetical protein
MTGFSQEWSLRAASSEEKDLHGSEKEGWIGVDLDGTLAEYHGWKGPEHIGKPIPKMIDRVKKWLEEGKDVRIMTARVAPVKGDAKKCREHVEKWTREIFDRELPITHEKDHEMLELWDDRVIQVIPNTGERADGKD